MRRLSPSLLALTVCMLSLHFAGCSALEQRVDRNRRLADYEKRLAVARRGGTRKDVQVAFPGMRLTTKSIFPMTGPLRISTEIYRLDFDFVLQSHFYLRKRKSAPKPLTFNEIDGLLFFVTKDGVSLPRTGVFCGLPGPTDPATAARRERQARAAAAKIIFHPRPWDQLSDANIQRDPK